MKCNNKILSELFCCNSVVMLFRIAFVSKYKYSRVSKLKIDIKLVYVNIIA